MLTTIGRSMHTRGQNWSKCLWQLAEPSYGPPSHAAWQRRSRRPWRLASSSEATLLPLASMSSLGWPGLHSHANSHLSRSSKQSPSKCGASASANMSCNSQPVLGLRTGPPRFVQFSHRSVRKICTAGRLMPTSQQSSEPRAATHRVPTVRGVNSPHDGLLYSTQGLCCRFPISVPGRRQSRSSLVPTEVCGQYTTKYFRRRLSPVRAGLIPDASTLVYAALLPAVVWWLTLSKRLIYTCCMQAEPSTTQTSEPGPDTALLKERLRPHPDLVLGKLDNGLNYAILPAVTPPGRFEAHLEIHAGKVWEC